MKIALISFTRQGANTCRNIEAGLTAAGYQCHAFGHASFAEQAGIRPVKESLARWTEAAFLEHDAIVFIGACGIAVRAIAPLIRDKTIDPAVIVVDEKGKYAISLLSGHIGGANRLTEEIAELIGAEPVITTATDLNNQFAVDVWAKKNLLLIDDMKLAKEISAAVLRGESIGVFSDFPIEGEWPGQLVDTMQHRIPSAGSAESGEKDSHEIGIPEIGFRISVFEAAGPFAKTLRLVPRALVIGIGCRKGISIEAAEAALDQVLKENGLSVKSIERLCTIDLKKDEAALKVLSERLGVPLQIFSAAELEQLTGDFTASEFVSQITGVDNVCERAAVLGSRGELIAGKRALNGVTIAVAVRTETYRFD